MSSGDTPPFSPAEQEQARLLSAHPETADPAAVSALPEPLALEVLDAAVKARSATLAEKLSTSPNKALAKAAKKALYRLRSMGVAIPEKRSEPVAAPTPAPAFAAAAPASLVSAITGTGERALIVGRPVRGRIETAQIVIADEHGIVHLGLNELSRGKYDKLLRDAHRPGAPSAIEISFEEARALVAEGAGINLRTRTPYPEGLEAVLRHLDLTPNETPPAVPPPKEGDQAEVVHGAALHDEPEIAQWLPPVDDLKRLALKVQEIATSPLYLDDAQRAAQLRLAIQSAAEGFLTEERRQLYGRRLWWMADFFARSGRPKSAAIARAEARRLFHAAPGVFSPFVLRMFEKVLTLSGMGPKLPPPESPAERPPPGEKRSPGGLILP
ncbi:MAG: hypothetical protein IRZ16_13015 [Myxococcaceae bacterium]|nr:hypothetical protein [Myxococcaceae bacterium]